LDIADIVRAHRGALESVRRLTREQKRALTDIAQCRTAVLGGHVDRCVDCGYEHPSYNSCRNRHCPKCQALAQEKWIEARRAKMLDTRHFHVVFTLPQQLRALSAFAPRAVYDALFHAATRTLLEFGKSRLGGTLGATLVLHTWNRELLFHPHVHAIVTGGAWSTQTASWRAARRKFLFPVRAMGRVLRAKMLAQLDQAYRSGAFARFDAFADPEGFARLMQRAAKPAWNVYAKPSFAKGQHVIAYLGRYTHRVGISNSRLVAISDAAVTFRTKHGGIAQAAPVAWLGRFVQHVLPDGLHKIRHIGLYASACAKRLELARSALGQSAQIAPHIDWHAQLETLTGRDLSRCPRCGGRLITVVVASTRCRDPPPMAA
jgi:predicted Zn-ribbon and HTH transcriptional regulator